MDNDASAQRSKPNTSFQIDVASLRKNNWETFGNLPEPEEPSLPKEWHRPITKDLRTHLVTRMVKAIFPALDPTTVGDQRIEDFISYVRGIEKETFEVADDREEYYNLLAEKIYVFEKEMQEKKLKRLREQSKAGSILTVGSQPSEDNMDIGTSSQQIRQSCFFQTSAATSSGVSGENFGNLSEAEKSAMAKEWHRQVTKELRNHFVTRIVKAIYPEPGPAAVRVQRTEDFTLYAKQVEKEAFEVANDREEYYQLLAEGVFKAQKNLNEIRLRSLSLQREDGVSDLSTFRLYNAQ